MQKGAPRCAEFSTPASSARRLRLGAPIRTAYQIGNPFVIGRDGSREEVIERYRAWLASQPDLLDALDELRGRDLVCWCAPQACHDDLLIELANQT
jgi:hypothetical protein